MDKELIVVKGKVIEQERGYSPDSGKEITYEQGAKMVKRHVDENPDDMAAHFIGRNIVEKILNQPDCVGIRAFHALNDLGIRRLVLTGVDKNGQNILQYNMPCKNDRFIKINGIVAETPQGCPPYCNGSSGTSGTSWW